MEKLRIEVDDKYKWNLSDMISDLNKYEEHCLKIEEITKNIESFKGHILDNSRNLFKVLELSNELERLLETIYVYSHMLCDTDTSLSEFQSLKIKSDKIISTVSGKLSFINPEILLSSKEKVLKFINELEDLKKYEFYFELMFRYKNHTLSKEEESIISLALPVMNTGSDVFYNLNNADIKLGFIKDENNIKVELTSSNYSRYLSSKDRRVRKEAFNKNYEFFKNHKNTLATSIHGNIKKNFFVSNIRKFNSPLEESLYHDNIDIKVYKNLIKSVHDNLDKMHEFMEIKAKMLNLDKIHMYDIYAEINTLNKEVTYEEAKKLINSSLSVLGKNYLDDLNKAFLESWIDVYPNKFKKSGAYSWGTYDSKPYILLNYDDTIDSVSTLAHELGHSMHSYYSKKNQDYIYHSYPIFLAEIASTVNEVLLNDYLYKNAANKEEKIYYLNELLEKIRTTIYRQTMFAEFEMKIHDLEKENIPLTEEKLSSLYLKLNKIYYGKKVVSDDLIKYEWSRIPHFYTSFYVYKYATGLSVALFIAAKILEGDKDMLEKYIEFLSSGGSDYPLNILNKLGIDMTSSDTINKALNLFGQKIIELKKLI